MRFYFALLCILSLCSSCFVISAGINSGYIQRIYSYEKYIYQDNYDLIRKKLLFYYTPILLALDEENIIMKALVLNSK